MDEYQDGSAPESLNEEEKRKRQIEAEQAAEVFRAEIDQEQYKKLAVKNLWSVLEGNVIDANEVEITKFEGDIIEFIAVTTLKIKTKTIDRRQSGKVTNLSIVDSEAQLKEIIKKEEHKITHSQDVIKRVKDVVLERKDKGFKVENEFIKLPFLHKSYAKHEPCTSCHSNGRVKCSACHGKGQATCPNCNGSGNITCHHCNGRQYVQGPNNERKQCMHCNGTGRTSCQTCHQSRLVQCKTCGGGGETTCLSCNGHAWNSKIFTVEIDAFANFEMDSERLPHKIAKYCHFLDKNMPNHVEFKPVIMGREHERDMIVIPYQVRVPNAELNFKLKNEMDLGAYMFGTQGRLYEMSYFLEALAKPGMDALLDAGTGKGDVAGLLIKASEYRINRNIILATNSLPKSRAYRKTMEIAPVGLSESKAKKLILSAEKALGQITKRPRQLGVIAGSALAGLLFMTYFHKMRIDIFKAISPSFAIHNLLDGLVCILGITLSIFTIKAMAGLKLQKTLFALRRKTGQKIKFGKAGDYANYAFGLTLFVFLASAYTTISSAVPAPKWVLELSKILVNIL